MPLHGQVGDEGKDARMGVHPLIAQRFGASMPRYRMPEDAIDPRVAAQLVRAELLLDGSARLNLATFVTTWMEPEAAALMAETFDKNMIDKDEYPQTAELEKRCVNILAELWHAQARPSRRPGRRRPAPARRRCSAGWRCCGAGASGGARRRAGPPTGRTS